uniref:Activated Cdc42 kinase-like n=1 Tax=Rhabditophanes sp. KR3021 TaxID=114890 RepID=A0AC35U7C7_9BILA
MKAKNSTGSINSHGRISLRQVLEEADLLVYEQNLQFQLKLRHAGDIEFVEEQDLSSIGMSRPEQKRLRKAYDKYYPPKSFVGKIKNVFSSSKNDGNERKDNVIEPPSKKNEKNEEKHVISPEKITLLKELGKGEFGSVYQATWHNLNDSSGTTGSTQVAVKCILPEKLIANPTSFLQEAAIMHKMEHENVVRLFGVVLDTKSIMLVSELAPCGSLLECLNKPALRDSFPVNVLCDFTTQIAKGMNYLAGERLIHRDLACRNILAFSTTKVKISDFGLSRSLGIGEEYYKAEMTPTLRLPIAWCAPECINLLKFTSASDIWSYAVTIWEMFSYGESPWNGYKGSEIFVAVNEKREKLSCPSACPSDLYQLLLKCWRYEPERRPTFKSLTEKLPDVMPQQLLTISECRDKQPDHLQFGKSEIIILIDRAPAAYPDGYYWRGALKDGQIGLFRPIETVAYLGAENPSVSYTILQSTPIIVPPVEKKGTNNEKEKKKKLLISEPQGDLRHTCHVGIDGRSFGLLQIDKNDLSKALPPSLSTFNQNSRHSPLHTSGSSTCSSEHSIQRLSGSQVTSSTFNPSSLKTIMRSPPALPPKPVHRTPLPLPTPSAPPFSGTSTMERSTTVSFKGEKSGNSSPTLSRQYPESFQATYERHSIPNSDEEEQAIVYSMAHDITNFTLSSLNDYKDDDVFVLTKQDYSKMRQDNFREQAKGSNKVIVGPNNPVEIPSLKLMSDGELQKWDKKVEKKHEEVKRKLSKELEKEKSKRKNSSNDSTEKSNNNDKEPPSLYKLTASTTKNFEPEWTEEAQRAYKLLVQCGDRLKTTSPIPEPAPRMRIIETKIEQPPISNGKENTEESHTHRLSSFSSVNSSDTDITVVTIVNTNEPSNIPRMCHSVTINRSNSPISEFFGHSNRFSTGTLPNNQISRIPMPCEDDEDSVSPLRTLKNAAIVPPRFTKKAIPPPVPPKPRAK